MTPAATARWGLWDCRSSAADQHWTHDAYGSLETQGRCLDIDGDGTAAGIKVELYDCNGVLGHKWLQEPNGSLLNPQSGLRLDDSDGNTANGTQLEIWPCTTARTSCSCTASAVGEREVDRDARAEKVR